MNRVQFNLLPDVKLEYIKTERTRKLVTSISILISSVSFGIFLLLLLTVNLVQKQQLNSARAEVEQASKKLEGVENIQQAITVNNQLETLSGLHQKKHITSRIFTYLPQITPTSVNISSLSIDFATNSMSVNGTARDHQAVNAFIDSLKYTKYKVGSESAQIAFPSVIESSFGITSTNVTYGLNIQFDPKLFSNDLVNEDGKPLTPEVVVPTTTTSRSILQTNGGLFKGQEGSGGQ